MARDPKSENVLLRKSMRHFEAVRILNDKPRSTRRRRRWPMPPLPSSSRLATTMRAVALTRTTQAGTRPSLTRRPDGC